MSNLAQLISDQSLANGHHGQGTEDQSTSAWYREGRVSAPARPADHFVSSGYFGMKCSVAGMRVESMPRHYPAKSD
jgi:hypothetical protein